MYDQQGGELVEFLVPATKLSCLGRLPKTDIVIAGFADGHVRTYKGKQCVGTGFLEASEVLGVGQLGCYKNLFVCLTRNSVFLGDVSAKNMRLRFKQLAKNDAFSGLMTNDVWTDNVFVGVGRNTQCFEVNDILQNIDPTSTGRVSFEGSQLTLID